MRQHLVCSSILSFLIFYFLIFRPLKFYHSIKRVILEGLGISQNSYINNNDINFLKICLNDLFQIIEKYILIWSFKPIGFTNFVILQLFHKEQISTYLIRQKKNFEYQPGKCNSLDFFKLKIQAEYLELHLLTKASF